MGGSPDVDVKYVRNTETPGGEYGAFRIILKTYKGDFYQTKVNLMTDENKELDSQVCSSFELSCELIFSQDRFPAGRHTLLFNKYYYSHEQGRWFHIEKTKISMNVGPGYTTHATVDWGYKVNDEIATAVPTTVEH